MKIESIYIYVLHKNKNYCLIGNLWFKSDEDGYVYPIHSEILIEELNQSFKEITETLNYCPACKTELSYKNGVFRNGLCVLHYEEFMA